MHACCYCLYCDLSFLVRLYAEIIYIIVRDQLKPASEFLIFIAMVKTHWKHWVFSALYWGCFLYHSMTHIPFPFLIVLHHNKLLFYNIQMQIFFIDIAILGRIKIMVLKTQVWFLFLYGQFSNSLVVKYNMSMYLQKSLLVVSNGISYWNFKNIPCPFCASELTVSLRL